MEGTHLTPRETKSFIHAISTINVHYFLLMFTILGAFAGIVSAVVPQIRWAYLIVFITWGLGLGWFLGINQVNGRWMIAVGFIVGLIFIFIRAGALGEPILHLIQSVERTAWDFLLGAEVVPGGPMTQAWDQFKFQALSVMKEAGSWTANALSGSPSYSYIASRGVWGLAMWTATLWMGWFLFRHDFPLMGFFPVAAGMSVLMTYIPGQKQHLLAVSIGAGLALVGFATFERHKTEWRKIEIPSYKRLSKNVSISILITSFFVMIIATVTPSLSLDALSAPLQEWQRAHAGEDQIMRALGVEFQPGSAVRRLSKITQLPRSQLIGSGPELEENIVMVVSLPGIDGSPDQLPMQARYWRSYSYDRYIGSGWTSSSTVDESFAPGQPIQQSNTEYAAKIVQEFRLSQHIIGPLYASGNPLTVNQEFITFWRVPVQEENISREEVSYHDIFAVSVESGHYQVVSGLPLQDETDLRNAKTGYPAWIKKQYLSLPDSVPERVINLALHLVKDANNPFDKAKSIEGYLRTFPYTLDLPSPPQDRDVVDYFLFELEKGYCDYYASSMVVMARAAGIPARLSVGYIQGNYDSEMDQYIVTEAQAHSWPELYFPEIGWVPFEPTALRSTIDHQRFSLPVPPELKNSQQTQHLFGVRRDVFYYILPASALILVVVSFPWLDLWLLQRRDARQALVLVFQRLFRAGYWLGIKLSRPATPRQFTQSMTLKLTSLRGGLLGNKLIERSINNMAQLTQVYHECIYGPPASCKGKRPTIIPIWRRLRWQLLAAFGENAVRNVISKVKPLFFG